MSSSPPSGSSLAVSSGTAATAEPRRHLGLALAVICTAQLMVILDATIVNVALPAIKRDLHFSSTSLAWVINAYALAFGGLLLLGGRAGDIFGRRRMFIIGVLLFAGASLVGGFANSEAWLITARAVQGVGGAIASPTALALVASTFPEGPSRNRAMGVYAAMSAAGGAVGLLLGGILTEYASWRWVFFVNAPIGIVVALAAPAVLARGERQRASLDLPGAFTVAGGMTLLVYGLSHAATASWSSAGTVVPLVIAAVLLTAFILIERQTSHPLMPLRIFANRNRSGAYAIMLTIGAGIFAMFFFLTLFLQIILGYSPLKTGVAFLPVTVVIAIAAGITSQIIGRVGPRTPIMAGTLLAAAGLFWLSFVNTHATYPDIIFPILLLGIGMGFCFVPLTVMAVSKVRPHEQGLASALLNTGQQIGGSLGLAVFVTVAATVTRDNLSSHASPGVRPTPGAARHALAVATTDGYTTAFRVGALVLLFAFVIAAAVLRVGPADLAPTETRVQPEPEPVPA